MDSTLQPVTAELRNIISPAQFALAEHSEDRAQQWQVGLGVQEEEGTCIGQWSKRCCNHWISTDAVVQYVCQEAEEQRFRMRCPVCAAARCERCALHGGGAQRDGGCCYIPPRQIRELLSEDQMARCGLQGPQGSYAQQLILACKVK